MRMIRKQLDPQAPFGPSEVGDAPRLTVRQLFVGARGESPEQAAAALEPENVSIDARRTTIWFNAWKYQSGEQLWAGLLAPTRFSPRSSERLTPLARDRLWASIQLRRVSHDEVRRRLYKHVAVRLVPYAIGTARGGGGRARARPGPTVLGTGGHPAERCDHHRRRSRARDPRRLGGGEQRHAGLVQAPNYEEQARMVLHLVQPDCGASSTWPARRPSGRSWCSSTTSTVARTRLSPRSSKRSTCSWPATIATASS